MADPVTWFSIASTAMSFVGKMQAASATRAAGQRQLQNAQIEQANLNQEAGQQQAAAQRKALEHERTAKLMASRALAVAGGGGGGVTDPTVVNLIADIAGRGAYNSGVDIYQGEENARKLRQEGGSRFYAGQVAAEGANQKASALQTSAWGSALTGAGTMYSRFGNGGPSKADYIDPYTYADNYG